MITNPQKSIKLRADDLVFVLAQNDPSSPETWDDYNYFNNAKGDAEDENMEAGAMSQIGSKRYDSKVADQITEQTQEKKEAVKHLDPFIEQKLAR